MKNIILLICLLTVSLAWTQKLWTEEDRQYLLDNLNRTTAALEAEVANLTDAQWHFKETPESWSIAQVIEHLGIYERKYYNERYVVGLMPAEPQLLETTKEDSYYVEWMAEEQPHNAPTGDVPLELMPGKNNWTYFLEGRKLNIKRITENQVDFRTHFTYRSNEQRWNIHQLYIILFAHCDRHLRQVMRIKSHPDFPKSGLSLDEEKEVAAIMRTIEAETDCFFHRDYDCWKQQWVQGDHVFQAWSNSDATIDARTGWTAVDEGIGNYIKNNPVPEGQSSHPKVIRKNQTIKFYTDEVAYLTWDQYNSSPETGKFRYSKESRIMEKHNGHWKIAHVSALWDYGKWWKAEELKN